MDTQNQRTSHTDCDSESHKIHKLELP